jgi:transcriptional regulator with XRE-family HTH domain
MVLVQDYQEGILRMDNIADVQAMHYTKGMSEALGAYLKTLREGRRLRVNEVLRQLGARLHLEKPVDQTRLWRAENGKSWPEGDFLVALLDIIGADLSDVAWIQQHPEANASEGESRAQSILSQGSYRKATQLTENIPDVDVGVALDFVRQLRSSPEALAELRRLLSNADAPDDAQQP